MRGLTSRVDKSIPKPEAPVVLITSSTARYFVRQILENTQPNLFVLSHNEIPPEMKVVSLGIVQ